MGPSSEEVAGFGKEVQDLLGGDGWDMTGLESRKCREEGFWWVFRSMVQGFVAVCCCAVCRETFHCLVQLSIRKSRHLFSDVKVPQLGAWALKKAAEKAKGSGREADP